MSNLASQDAALSDNLTSSHSADGFVNRTSVVLLLLAVWAGTHPYLGVVLDARFYNVQILRYLSFGDYSTDLYFRYGSQDAYSMFTVLFAPVIRMFGLSSGNIILNLGFQGLWLSGAWYLVRALVRDRRFAVLATAAVITLPGGIGFVHYGEQLLTPRLLAEALTLWALGALLRGYPLRALAVLTISFSVHPLMTLPGLGIWFLYVAYSFRWLWVLAALFATVLVGSALLGVKPVDRLAEVFDPEWFSVVVVRDSFCFITNWELTEWLQISNTLAVAVVGFILAEPAERRLLGASTVVAFSGLAASFVGADLLHLVLVSDAQLWRAVWLLSFVANACFAIGIMRAAKFRRPFSENASWICILAGIFLASSRFAPNLALLVTPIALVGLSVHLREHYGQAPLKAIGRVLVTVLLGIACGLGLFAVFITIKRCSASLTGGWWTFEEWPVVAIGLLAMWFQTGISKTTAVPAHHSMVRIGLAIGMLSLTLAMWDQRLPWIRFVDSDDGPPSSLSKLVAGTGDLYWEGDMTVPWFLLRKTDYFSCEQGTGVLFKRGTAMAYQQRYDNFQKLGTLDFRRETFCPGNRDDTVSLLTRDDLTSVCNREAGLGRLVLMRPVEGVPTQSWTAPVAFQYTVKIDKKPQYFESERFYTYACADYRSH